MSRKFKTGDVVKILPYDPKGPMRYFPHGEAILYKNYRQEFGPCKEGAKEWGVFIDGKPDGYSAWHPEDSFELVKPADKAMQLKAYQMGDRL